MSIYAYVYICTHVYKHAHMYLCTYIYIYIYICGVLELKERSAALSLLFCVLLFLLFLLLLVDWRPSWASLYEGVFFPLSRRPPFPLREGGNHGWKAALCGRRLRRGCTSGAPRFLFGSRMFPFSIALICFVSFARRCGRRPCWYVGCDRIAS